MRVLGMMQKGWMVVSEFGSTKKSGVAISIKRDILHYRGAWTLKKASNQPGWHEVKRFLEKNLQVNLGI